MRLADPRHTSGKLSMCEDRGKLDIIENRCRVRTFSALLVVLSAALGFGCGEPRSAAPEVAETDGALQSRATQNVVLIVLDALRADRINAVRDGKPLMPNLAGFAATAWRFTNATCQETWTKPSVVSLLTSLYPQVHRVQFGIHNRITDDQDMTADVVPDSIQTVASYLRLMGFHTVGIQANANLQAQFGVDQGFDQYIYRPYPDYFRADKVTDTAVEMLGTTDPPFFVYVHYMDPHAPYDPPARYREMFTEPPLTDGDKTLLAQYNGYYLDHVFFRLGMKDARQMDSFSVSGKEHIRYLYDAEVRFADHEVGRLIETIESRAPDTVIIVTADHGEELWEHGSVGHGKTVYGELTHVPLLMRFPGVEPQQTDVPAELIDIVPTVATYLGLDPSPDWQGTNLISAVHRAGLRPRPMFSQAKGSLELAKLHLESVTLGTDKLIVDHAAGGTAMLYDLSHDPDEKIDLATERSDKVDELRALLADHAKTNEAHPKAASGPGKATLDQKTIQQLKTLNYI